MRTVWVQAIGWKWLGRRPGGQERAWMRGRVRTVWVQGKMLEMGWGEGPVGRSKFGCVDVCGGCRCKSKVGNVWGEGPVGMSERGWRRTAVGRSERGCAEVCGQCGCMGEVGNG